MKLGAVDHEVSDRDSVLLGNGWLLALSDLGINQANVLRRARLPEDLVKRPDARLPALDYFRLWESFFRAFREWTGTTPDRVRTQLAS